MTISFIGYRAIEVKVGNQQSLSVTLDEDMEVLDEVVVVGYGSQLKKTVTGAISSVKAKELEAPNAVSADNLLQGKVAGLSITQIPHNRGQACLLIFEVHFLQMVLTARCM